jgi:hypothetical protein
MLNRTLPVGLFTHEQIQTVFEAIMELFGTQQDKVTLYSVNVVTIFHSSKHVHLCKCFR